MNKNFPALDPNYVLLRDGLITRILQNKLWHAHHMLVASKEKVYANFYVYVQS